MDRIQIHNNRIFIKGDDLILSDVYTFAHDMSEPHCNHFKSKPISILYSSDDSILFEQNFSYLGDIVGIAHEISVRNGIRWKMKKINPYRVIPCRFGISIPITGDILANGASTENLVNYEMHWRYSYPGQTNLSLPVVKTKLGHPCFVAFQLDNNVQLFSYQEEQRRLKIASMYEEDSELEIKIASAGGYDDKEGYVWLFPEAENYVYSWNATFSKIEQKYGVTVNHQTTTAPLTSRLLTQEELTSFATILEEELSFYPASFWKNKILSRITVSGDVRANNKTIHGHYHHDGILLNGSESSPNIRKAIHHEIFHLVDSNGDDPIPKDSFHEHYQLGRSIVSPGDYRAELVAHYIVDTPFIQNMMNNDPLVKSQWNIILDSLSTDLKRALQNHKPAKNNIGLVTTVSSVKPVETPTTDLNFIAIQHVDKRALETILNMSIEWQTLSSISSQAVCLTMNPLDYCAIEFSLGTLPETSMEDWLQFHREAALKSVFFLQVEKIYQSQWAFLKRFFSRTGLEINKKARLPETFRTTPLKGIPTLENVWNRVRSHPVIEKVGYHQISLQE